MLFLTHVHIQILVSTVLADDHPSVYLDPGADEHGTPFLGHEDGVACTCPVFVRDKRAMRGHEEVSLFRRLVGREDMVQNDGPSGLGQQYVFKSHDTAGRNVVLQMHLTGPDVRVNEPHMPQFASALSELLDHGSLVGLRHLDGQLFVRLHDLVAFAMDNDLRLGDLQFVPFPSHLFDQDGEMQFPSSRHKKAISAVGLIDAERYIGLQLLEQALAQVARGEEFAFASGEWTVVDGEGHLYGRLINRHAREGNRVVGIGDGVADAHVIKSGDCNDFAGRCLFGVGPV